MKTEILVQMDGLAKTDDLVFLLAASNLPWFVKHLCLKFTYIYNSLNLLSFLYITILKSSPKCVWRSGKTCRKSLGLLLL